MRSYKERRIYYFRCTGCGHENRQTLKRRKAKLSICRKCIKNYIHPNQQSLFPTGVLPEGEGKEKNEPQKSKKNPTVVSQRDDRAFATVR